MAFAADTGTSPDGVQGDRACCAYRQTMHVSVVDWNVNGFVHRAQAGLLAGLEWDVACLQEVTHHTWRDFRALGDAGDVAFSYLPPLAGDGPRYGCAVVVHQGVELVDFGVLRDVPSPERAAVAKVRIAGHSVWVASWAAPPGVTWGSGGKGRQVERFAAWLRDRPGPTIVGIDRNAPKWERHDLVDDEWWNPHEPLLYGVDRVHDLRDTYREYLATYPELAAHIRAERPDGPLAVTHTRRGIECRYDAIYASPEFSVEGVDHLWDEAREAGSDHALVRAVLRWRSS